MFTIKVRKRGEKEDFTYEKVSKEARVFHEDCGGAEVNWDLPDCGCPWIFRCLTCGAQTEVPSILDAKLKIVETAMDGSEREVCENIRVTGSSEPEE
ncbi:MAG: hypothetical protein AB1426_09010 [Bacillota bacterium]